MVNNNNAIVMKFTIKTIVQIEIMKMAMKV
jgi:hypothetical protein